MTVDRELVKRPDSMSGEEIFRWWYDSDRPVEEHTPGDQYFVLYRGELDFDYLMGYLLEVRWGYGKGCADFLFCFQRHAGHGDITIQWRDLPHLMFDGQGATWKAMHEFVDFCKERIENYDREVQR